jgi:hypothetical protein
MTRINRAEIPDGALLAPYQTKGAYTDCFTLDVSHAVSQEHFIAAFYTSWLFKIERSIIAIFVRMPSTDVQALALAAKQSERFSAWTVEARTQDQLLLCDYQSRSRSWLMTASLQTGGTRLYFGSAVLPRRPDGQRDYAFWPVFRLVTPLHRLYSRALLRAATDGL